MNLSPEETRQVEEAMEDMAKGAYDPDIHGYWSEHEETCYLRIRGGEGTNCDCSYSREAEHEATDTR